jgi:hypothetical protein
MNMTMGTSLNFILLDNGTIINVEDIYCVEKTWRNILLKMKHHDLEIAISEHDYQVLIKKLIVE